MLEAADMTSRSSRLEDEAGRGRTRAVRCHGIRYVAGSRSQQLLICAIHRKHSARIAALLDKIGLSYVNA